MASTGTAMPDSTRLTSSFCSVSVGLAWRVLVAQEAGEGVPVGEPDERTDPGGLQACGVRDGEVDAGAEALVENLGRGPDLLPGALERRGRIDVADVRAVQRLIDRRGDHCGPFRAGLIPTERGVTGGFLQDPRGGVEDGGDGTGVRLNEGGERVVEDRRVEPLVVREDLDRDRELDRVTPQARHGDGDRRAVALVEPLQLVGCRHDRRESLPRLLAPGFESSVVCP